MQTLPSQPRLLDAVTPVSPFKSSTRLLSPNIQNNWFLIHGALHVIIAITVIVLYIEALNEDFFYANLLCYTEDINTGTITPCNGNDKEINTVYSASILHFIDNSWRSENYHISIILFFISFIFPFINILNNLRMAFKQSTPIKIRKNGTSSSYGSIICECLHKSPMLYLFGCILMMNGLYQSTSTNMSDKILYQEIVIEADIAVNILIVAVIMSSIWSVYLQFRKNNHLFGFHKYIFHENNSAKLILIGFLIIIAGILVIITYFMKIQFIQFKYPNDWSVYNTTFDDEQRKYNFISMIHDVGNKNNKDNNDMLIGFYYLYVFIIPTVCYVGNVILSLVLKYYQYQIRKVLLMSLFYLFLCFNGLDMLLITSIVMKYLLPLIWDNIIHSIYKDFCAQFIIIENNQLCDDLRVDVMLKDAMWIGAVFVFILLIIFCLMNDFKCSKHRRYKYQSESRYKTDTWDYGNTLAIHHHQESTRNTLNDSYAATTESEVHLSRLIMPYSSSTSTN